MQNTNIHPLHNPYILYPLCIPLICHTLPSPSTYTYYNNIYTTLSLLHSYISFPHPLYTPHYTWHTCFPLSRFLPKPMSYLHFTYKAATLIPTPLRHSHLNSLFTGFNKYFLFFFYFSLLSSPFFLFHDHSKTCVLPFLLNFCFFTRSFPFIASSKSFSLFLFLSHSPLNLILSSFLFSPALIFFSPYTFLAPLPYFFHRSLYTSPSSRKPLHLPSYTSVTSPYPSLFRYLPLPLSLP